MFNHLLFINAEGQRKRSKGKSKGRKDFSKGERVKIKEEGQK